MSSFDWAQREREPEFSFVAFEFWWRVESSFACTWWERVFHKEPKGISLGHFWGIHKAFIVGLAQYITIYMWVPPLISHGSAPHTLPYSLLSLTIRLSLWREGPSSIYHSIAGESAYLYFLKGRVSSSEYAVTRYGSEVYGCLSEWLLPDQKHGCISCVVEGSGARVQSSSAPHGQSSAITVMRGNLSHHSEKACSLFWSALRSLYLHGLAMGGLSMSRGRGSNEVVIQHC
jgi:hypothetical protein